MFYFAPGYSPFTSNGQQAKPNPNGTAVPITSHYITTQYHFHLLLCLRRQTKNIPFGRTLHLNYFIFTLYITGGYGSKPNKPGYGAQPSYGISCAFLYICIRLGKI